MLLHRLPFLKYHGVIAIILPTVCCSVAAPNGVSFVSCWITGTSTQFVSQ